MREIVFKTYIPFSYDQCGNRIQGSGKLSETYTESGFFHKWGESLEYSQDTAVSYTVGIVELPTGEIVEVDPGRIKFVEPFKPETKA